jgi:hypothetical protein
MTAEVLDVLVKQPAPPVAPDPGAPVAARGRGDLRAPAEPRGRHALRAPVEPRGRHDLRPPAEPRGRHELAERVDLRELAYLREQVALARSHRATGAEDLCSACGWHWPCPAYFAARRELIAAAVHPREWA